MAKALPDHIEPHLWVADLPAARRFYELVLGFELVQSYPPGTPNWMQLRRGSALVMLATLPDPAKTTGTQAFLSAVAERRGGGAVSLYLNVASADAVHAACVEAGVAILEPIWDAWWGGRQFTVADPDGNWWTIFQPSDPAEE